MSNRAISGNIRDKLLHTLQDSLLYFRRDLLYLSVCGFQFFKKLSRNMSSGDNYRALVRMEPIKPYKITFQALEVFLQLTQIVLVRLKICHGANTTI
ncbi:MAG: hypothetical protein CMD54_06160 [Gammaproteobacteria bacterium]|nr:hypothetical protein [Gammaproteobacteria bacterium]